MRTYYQVVCDCLITYVVVAKQICDVTHYSIDAGLDAGFRSSNVAIETCFYWLDKNVSQQLYIILIQNYAPTHSRRYRNYQQNSYSRFPYKPATMKTRKLSDIAACTLVVDRSIQFVIIITSACFTTMCHTEAHADTNFDGKNNSNNVIFIRIRPYVRVCFFV